MEFPRYYYDAAYRANMINKIIEMCDVACLSVKKENLEKMDDVELSDEYANVYDEYMFMCAERSEAMTDYD